MLGKLYQDFLREEESDMMQWKRMMSTLMDYLILFSEFKKGIKRYRYGSVPLLYNSDHTPTPIS